METKFLDSKEKKQLLMRISKQYGINELKLDYIFLKDQKGKIYLISNKLREFDRERLNIVSYGLYFAREESELRLSIEGSQLIGKNATKNIIELNEKQIKQWMQGLDIDIDSDCDGFVLIKHNKDFYGCGKYKDNKILNFISKDRRIKFE
ncbi:MAG: hypothetical protein PHG05_03770 [Candidatus Nanoarchaeia archaeon]|nr:hypothetical protein [Candidatus Nanoarchaeia archaeon]